MEHGENIHCKGSGNKEIIFLSRKARQSAQGIRPDLGRIFKNRCPYLVIAENSDVITVGHRTKKIRRH